MRPGNMNNQYWVFKANTQSDQEKEEEWEKIYTKNLQIYPT